MARSSHVKISPCEKRALLELDERLTDLGFPDMGPREFATKILTRKGWATTEQFLNAVKRDVWWGYSHVGDPDDKDVYDAADELVYDAIGAIQRCKR